MEASSFAIASSSSSRKGGEEGGRSFGRERGKMDILGYVCVLCKHQRGDLHLPRRQYFIEWLNRNSFMNLNVAIYGDSTKHMRRMSMEMGSDGTIYAWCYKCGLMIDDLPNSHSE